MLRYTVICLSVILSISASRIQCPPDKIYKSCGSRCPPSCSDPPNKACTLDCVSGCFCRSGLLLNNEGYCVTPENCEVSSEDSEECVDDEVYMECGSQCPQTCESENSMANCPAVCVIGCFCPPGKVRNTTSGRCVDLESCRRCPENEEYNQCGTHCPLTCQQPNPVACTKDCAFGCFCKNGTIRDEKTNKCVNPQKCTTCGTNEEFKECGTACPKTCTNLNPTVCTKQCVIGCACKEGFVKDEVTNKCVNLTECKCPGNEIFNSCGSACPATCKAPKPTICTKQCVPGCYCPKGLLRDDLKKQCVKPSQCAKCPGNEVFKTCGTACPATCKNPKPTTCNDLCIAGCFCPEGFVRNEATKQCVKQSQCAKCPGNEVYNTCGTACPPTCTNLKPTICTLQCVTGCFCPEGYVRDKNTGQCVKPTNCTCPKNEIFKECGSACPQTCSKLEPIKCTAQCVSGCFCTDDLVRDTESNKCIKPSQCKRNCTDGEIYDECGSACPSTCDSKQNVCTQQCVSGCRCQDDLVRDVNSGRCIPPAQCPINDESCTNPNEFFNECGSNCEPTCSVQNPFCNKVCKIGCFCVDGYIRNSENKCIQKEQC